MGLTIFTQYLSFLSRSSDIALFLAFLLCASIASVGAQEQTTTLTDQQRNAIADLVTAHYWQPVGRDSVLKMLSVGGLDLLDQYSSYLSPAEWSEFKVNLGGSFGGIGIFIDQDSATRQFFVGGVFRNSPAHRAGIKRRDQISRVDGVSVHGLSIDEVFPKLRGLEGTTVVVELIRGKSGDTLTFTLQREEITTPSVRGAQVVEGSDRQFLLEGTEDIAYVRITNFSRTTAADMDSALAAIARLNVRGLILDIRGNIGGLMKAALAVADMFLDSTVMITVKERTEPDDVRLATRGVQCALPVALLVDDSTVSSAEIFASAIQDNHRAVVIGRCSFGKGMIQQLFALPDSASGIKLTIAQYVRPSGRPIERHLSGFDPAQGGICPDSGMSFDDSLEVVAKESAAIIHADRLWEFADIEIPKASSATDRVIARACEVLRTHSGSKSK